MGRLPNQAVVFGRLLARLGAVRSAPLAVVVAPAGFGKSTLLSHYAELFSGHVSWLSVGPADADPARLASRVRSALLAPAPRRPATDLADATDLAARFRLAHATSQPAMHPVV